MSMQHLHVDNTLSTSLAAPCRATPPTEMLTTALAVLPQAAPTSPAQPAARRVATATRRRAAASAPLAGRALPARWPSSLRARYQTRATRWGPRGMAAVALGQAAEAEAANGICSSAFHAHSLPRHAQHRLKASIRRIAVPAPGVCTDQAPRSHRRLNRPPRLPAHLPAQLFCKEQARMSCECLRQCHAHYCNASTIDPGNYDCISYREPLGGWPAGPGAAGAAQWGLVAVFGSPGAISM
jgi:hypothetical protein